MRVVGNATRVKVWACAVALALSGCGGADDDAVAMRAVDLGSPVDAADHAGDVQFHIVETFAARDKDIPFGVFLGLAPDLGTRIAANALVDLRALQQELPELLTTEFDPACGLGIDVDFTGAEAAGGLIRASAVIDARVYRCRNRGAADEQRGGRLIVQTIDVVATLGGVLEDECIAFRLEEVDLAPRGLLGRLATLFGVTERARTEILAQARASLTANPVCLDLPEGLAPLDPQFSVFALREIGAGGIGATGSGSVDLGAEKLLRLLAVAEARSAVSDGMARVVMASDGRLEIRIGDILEMRGREIPYGIDIGLDAIGPTRIGIETTLDLRGLQAQLPDLLAGETLVDICGGRVALRRLEAEAREERLIATGLLDVETFDCGRTGPGTWERGALLKAEEVGVRVELSAEVVEGCVVFRLLDLARDPPGALGQLETGSGRAEAARALLLEAVGLLLEENPLCPDVPEELAVLDPSFDRGAPQEIGEGGVGVVLDGSIEVSPRTVIDLLRLLQARGVVPAAP